MSLTELLRRLAESNEKAKRRYYETETGVRFTAWEEAEHRLLSTTLELLPAIRRELEAGRAAWEANNLQRYDAVQWCKAAIEYDAARADADEEARKHD